MASDPEAVCVLQHADCEGPGGIGTAVEAAKHRLRVIRSFRGEPVPSDIGDAPALIVMGGPMGVYEADRYPFLRDELRLIESCLKRGKPVLGVCLGSQLLAHALGAEVRKGPRKEIGWFPVHAESAAASDPLFSPEPRSFEAMHWHGDVFGLPSGAAALARSDLTPLQAFRWGSNCYGLLFHLETGPAMIAEWTRSFAEELAAERLDPSTISGPEQSPRFDRMSRRAAGFFGRWADAFLNNRAPCSARESSSPR